jgi:hypothetical protein
VNLLVAQKAELIQAKSTADALCKQLQTSVESAKLDTSRERSVHEAVLFELSKKLEQSERRR